MTSSPAMTAIGFILPRTTMQAWMRISESRQEIMDVLRNGGPFRTRTGTAGLGNLSSILLS